MLQDIYQPDGRIYEECEPEDIFTKYLACDEEENEEDGGNTTQRRKSTDQRIPTSEGKRKTDLNNLLG